ncbi:MAG TPA: cytochrome c, partial [Bacteroidia bacterium]|nr:cytochrome c [Bacteroidia bacterium]
MKKLILITGIATLIYACSGSSENKTSDTAAAETATATETPEEKQAADARGIGKFTNVEVGETLDA